MPVSGLVTIYIYIYIMRIHIIYVMRCILDQENADQNFTKAIENFSHKRILLNSFSALFDLT